MKMRRGKVSGFAIAIAVLLTFQQQGAVYGSSSVTPSLSSTYSSISSSLTSSTSVSGQNTTTSSPTQPPSTTALSQNATSPTSATTSETPSTSGTASPPDETTSQPTGTQPLDIKKTCAEVTATLRESITKENVTQILRHSFFIESKFREPNITILKTDPKEVTFSVCVKVVFNGEVESDFERLVRKLLNATGVTIKIIGVEIKDWKVVDGECDKCSDGGGGPFKIKGNCKPKTEEYSCNGVKESVETKDCSKYCSGVVSFTVSYLLVSVGIALSLSFYL